MAASHCWFPTSLRQLKSSCRCSEELLPSQAFTFSNCALHSTLNLNAGLPIYSVQCHPFMFRHLLQPSEFFILSFIVVAISSEFASYTNLMSMSSVSTSKFSKKIGHGQSLQWNPRDLPEGHRNSLISTVGPFVPLASDSPYHTIKQFTFLWALKDFLRFHDPPGWHWIPRLTPTPQ